MSASPASPTTMILQRRVASEDIPERCRHSDPDGQPRALKERLLTPVLAGGEQSQTAEQDARAVTNGRKECG